LSHAGRCFWHLIFRRRQAEQLSEGRFRTILRRAMADEDLTKKCRVSSGPATFITRSLARLLA
jgi:hypothetical protein